MEQNNQLDESYNMKYEQCNKQASRMTTSDVCENKQDYVNRTGSGVVTVVTHNRGLLLRRAPCPQWWPHLNILQASLFIIKTLHLREPVEQELGFPKGF